MGLTGQCREKMPLLHADRDFDRLAEHEGLMSVS